MRFHSLLSSLFGAAVAITTPPRGAAVVGKDGSFTTIQKAVDSGANVIFIQPGTYNERVTIQADNVIMYGSSSTSDYTGNTVTVTANLAQADGLGNEYTGTLRAFGDNFKLYNVNVVNSYGMGSQAVALGAFGKSQAFYGCSIQGFQDTLYCRNGNQYFSQCRITGATDFIFGMTSVIWIEKSTIATVASPYMGFLTASGRDNEQNPSYYVINKSTVVANGKDTVSNGQFFLGRPWRNYARVAVQNTDLGAVVNPAGWSIWIPGDEHTDHVQFREYGNTGAGAQGQRASFSSKLSAPLTLQGVMGNTAWIDSAYL